MRARMLVDAKIVRADPDHPLAIYRIDQELEGPAAELQVALGHAQILPEIAIAEEPAPEPALEESEESHASEAPAAARAEDGA